jgi:hypothetical protein
MSKPKVSVSQINIIAKNYDATLRFYRMVGLDIPEPINQPLGALHAVSKKIRTAVSLSAILNDHKGSDGSTRNMV